MVPRSTEDETEYERLGAVEDALAELEDTDVRAYGTALLARVVELAAETYPDLAIEVEVHAGFPQDQDPDVYEGPQTRLRWSAVGTTPLPWSHIAPDDYPAGETPWRKIANAERAAGRLPHQRVQRRTTTDLGAE